MVLLCGGNWKYWEVPGLPASFPGGRAGIVFQPANADLPALCRRIAGTIRELRARVICLRQSPPRRQHIEAFVAHYLGGQCVVHTSNADRRPSTFSCTSRRRTASRSSHPSRAIGRDRA